MLIKVNYENKFDLKQTAKIYASEYASRLARKALEITLKGVDKLDEYIVK